MGPRLWVAALWLACCGCSMTRAVRPVGAHRAAVGVSVGGPLFLNLGLPLPMPLTAVYARYGLDAVTDVDLGVHLPVARATGLDVGIARLLSPRRGPWPALMASLRLLGFINGRAGWRRPHGAGRYPLDFCGFEEANLTASYDIDRWLLWLGVDAFMQLQRGALRPSAGVGASWSGLRPWEMGIEAKWLAFAQPTGALAIGYPNIGGYGAWALQIGLSYHFALGGR